MNRRYQTQLRPRHRLSGRNSPGARSICPNLNQRRALRSAAQTHFQRPERSTSLNFRSRRRSGWSGRLTLQKRNRKRPPFSLFFLYDQVRRKKNHNKRSCFDVPLLLVSPCGLIFFEETIFGSRPLTLPKIREIRTRGGLIFFAPMGISKTRDFLTKNAPTPVS